MYILENFDSVLECKTFLVKIVRPCPFRYIVISMFKIKKVHS